MSCLAITLKGKQCARRASDSEFCKQHRMMVLQDSSIEIKKLESQASAYKKELACLHERVRAYVSLSKKFQSSVQLIEDFDRIKLELNKLEPNEPYSKTTRNLRFKDKLETIFSCPFSEISKKYIDMRDQRNKLCHKFTLQTW